jgi:hypothetical protein
VAVATFRSLMPLPDRLAQRVALCLVTTMAVVTVHELVHIAVGLGVGIGGHFTSLTSADSDPARTLAATAGARAWMAGAAPMFTISIAVGALLAAPWARRRAYQSVATILGWIAIFGIPYIGVQLMTLGGPAGGVDTAAVLVGYFGLTGTPRAVLAVGGVVFTIGAGYMLGSALGDRQPASSPVLAAGADMSAARRIIGIAVTVLSICLIGAGAALLARPGRGNPMGAFLLADILWGVGMLITTPWRQPGPRFVRDVWLAPGIAAMGLLTVTGVLFPSDYAAAGLFFLPQLATAAYAARHQEFRQAAHVPRLERIGAAAGAV